MMRTMLRSIAGLYLLILLFHYVEQTHTLLNTNTNISDKVQQFTYKSGERFDVTFVLENVPAGVTGYTAYYSTPGRDITIKNGSIKFKTGEKVSPTITLKITSYEPEIHIYIRLLIRENICFTKQVGKGRAIKKDSSVWHWLQGTMDSFLSYFTPCGGYSCAGSQTDNSTRVDFHNECEEFIVMSTSPPTRLRISTLTLTPERFDNNTYWYWHERLPDAAPEAKQFKHIPRTRLYLHASNKRDKYNVRPVNSEEVQFSCQHHLNATVSQSGVSNSYVQVGTISPALDTMTTRSIDAVSVTRDTLRDGAVLCCVVYRVRDADDVHHVTRHIRDKTVFRHDNSTNDNTSELSVDHTRPGETNTGISNNTKYYAVASVALTLVLLLAIVITVRLVRRNKSHPVDQLELSSPSSPSGELLYAELDLQRRDDLRLHGTEESPYAQIIGTLKPNSNL